LTKRASAFWNDLPEVVEKRRNVVALFSASWGRSQDVDAHRDGFLSSRHDLSDDFLRAERRSPRIEARFHDLAGAFVGLDADSHEVVCAFLDRRRRLAKVPRTVLRSARFAPFEHPTREPLIAILRATNRSPENEPLDSRGAPLPGRS
jgi:hypothetical protein